MTGDKVIHCQSCQTREGKPDSGRVAVEEPTPTPWAKVNIDISDFPDGRLMTNLMDCCTKYPVVKLIQLVDYSEIE